LFPFHLSPIPSNMQVTPISSFFLYLSNIIWRMVQTK
jgi:hypothetical protein